MTLVSLPVEPYDPFRHDGGSDPIFVWINIRGLPTRLWKEAEWNHIAEEFGGFVVDIDPRSEDHIYFYVLRIRFGVAAKEVIPKSRRLLFKDENKKIRYYVLTFEIETERGESGCLIGSWNA